MSLTGNDNDDFIIEEVTNFLQDTRLIDGDFEFDLDFDVENIALELDNGENTFEQPDPLQELVVVHMNDDSKMGDEAISGILCIPTSDSDKSENHSPFPSSTQLKNPNLNEIPVNHPKSIPSTCNSYSEVIDEHLEKIGDDDDDDDMIKCQSDNLQKKVTNELHEISLNPSPLTVPTEVIKIMVYSNNETNPINHPKKTTTSTKHDKSNSNDVINNFLESGDSDDDDDDILKFQFNVNNTLEQLVKTMKQTELSRLSLSLAQQTLESCNSRVMVPNNNCFNRRNSVKSPSLNFYNHMQHSNTVLNKYNDVPLSSSPFQTSRRGSIGSSKSKASRRFSLDKPKASRRNSIGKTMKRSLQNRRSSWCSRHLNKYCA